MPYASIFDLPPAVRRLPEHGQEIFRAAFNAAWDSYANQEDREVAWAAVKKRYRHVGGEWIPSNDE